MKKDASVKNKQQIAQIGKFLKSLKSTFWVMLVVMVLVSLITFVIASATYTPEYRSTVRFTISPLLNSGDGNGAYDYDYNYNIVLARQMSETFPHIMQSSALRDIISYELDHNVNVRIESTAITDTNIFELIVTSPSADDAYDVINLLMEHYPKVAAYVVGDTRMEVIQGSEPVKATAPYNASRTLKFTVLGALLGLFLGFALLYVRFALRKTILSKNDIEIKLNGECVCEIPTVNKKKVGSKTLLRMGHGNSDFSESFRLLKQRVRNRMRTNGRKVIGVTSVLRGEGKTTVAYNLARSLSSGTSRVVLVDMDFRDRSLQGYLNRKKEVADTGITEVVVGKAKLNEVINSISDTFDVIFAGSENIKFRKVDYVELFKILRNTYDYIVVDMSSCDLASETASAADLCDELLFVIKSNTLPAEKVLNAMKYMSFSDAHFMGYVLSQISPDERSSGKYHYSRYYYSYGRRYGYGGRYGYGSRYTSRYAKPAVEAAGAAPETEPQEPTEPENNNSPKTVCKPSFAHGFLFFGNFIFGFKHKLGYLF